jgi:protein subunit release factor A
MINKGKTIMDKIILVELKSGEGGADSDLLVEDMTKVYMKAASKACL